MRRSLVAGWVALIVLSFRGQRWAYLTCIVLGLLYFPVRVGFHLQPHACELMVDARLLLFSFTNYAHIVLFGLFCVMSYVQFRAPGRRALAYANLATLTMGALVEIAE